MSRFKNTKTGIVVSVADDKDARFTNGWQAIDGSASSPAAEGYESLKVADLKAEIESRNEGREEADLLSAEGKKADLIAALEADDARSAGE